MKRLLTFLFTLCAITMARAQNVTLTSTTTTLEDGNAYHETSGSCGNNVTWNYDESTQTLTISGTGAMDNYSWPDFNQPWNYYLPTMTTIIIEDSVTTIGHYAFSNATSLTTAVIGNDVTTVGSSSFEQCTSLVNITMGKNVEWIDYCAFQNCEALKEITIPEEIQSIPYEGFGYCYSLSSIHLLPLVPPDVDSEAFLQCPIDTIYVPSKTYKAYQRHNFWGQFVIIAEDVEPTPVLKGDMNDDGTLTIDDITLLVDAILGREPDTHEYVDLGLPSGTLWATCNIGATNPEDFGDYFAWGEIVPYGQEDPSNLTNYNATGSYTRYTYNWTTYKWCNGAMKTITKYCKATNYGYEGFVDNLDELLPEDDAATAHWGSRWQMPSLEQFNELINSDYITIEEAEVNNVQGYRFTSKTNNNSIFLPCAWEEGGSSKFQYWSRSLNGNAPNASRLYYNGSIITTSPSTRYFGRTIRPVKR